MILAMTFEGLAITFACGAVLGSVVSLFVAYKLFYPKGK